MPRTSVEEYKTQILEYVATHPERNYIEMQHELDVRFPGHYKAALRELVEEGRLIKTRVTIRGRSQYLYTLPSQPLPPKQGSTW